jgi:hypothetical protein
MTEVPGEARASLLAEDGTRVEMQITVGPLDETRVEALARLWAEILVAALRGAEEGRASSVLATCLADAAVPRRPRSRATEPAGALRREGRGRGGGIEKGEEVRKIEAWK